MTTPHQAYNQGVNALANYLERDDPYLDIEEERELIIGQNPYPKDENAGWTLFKESDDIDFEALEGREAKLIDEDGGELTFTMRRKTFAKPAHEPYSWGAPLHAWMLFFAGWHGDDDWKLYIQGDLPTKRVTADTLEPGDIVNLHKDGTSGTWEYAVCVAPGKIAVADDNRTAVVHKHLEQITVTARLGQDPAYKEEA